MAEKQDVGERGQSANVWILVLLNEDGMVFQRANARGAYDDLATFPTKNDAELCIPAINAKWAFAHVTAKSVSVPSDLVGTPRV